MRSKMRMRYFCDHCKRSSGTRKSMEKHEAGCTANPNRKCSMCEIVGGLQIPMDEALQILRDKGFDELRSQAANCPACLLTFVRAAWEAGIEVNQGKWEFQSACRDFWAEYNEAQAEERAALVGYAYRGAR